MGHDQLFKEFLHAFLRDFMELFYPHVSRRLNFETLEFLNPQLFTDFPDGAVREVDVVARVETHDGRPELILVHIEIQGRPETNFGGRMLQYFALLGQRFQLPIFPVVVYLRGGSTGLAKETHRVSLFDDEQLVFRYQSVALARLSIEEYVRQGNPIAAALAALMNRRNTPEPVTLRALMMLTVAESKLSDAKKFLLGNMIETYFELDPLEQERYRQLISRKEYRKVQEVEMTWADKMKEKWLVEGKRQSLIRLLEQKFGPLPDDVLARIRKLESEAQLDRYLSGVLTATALEELGV